MTNLIIELDRIDKIYSSGGTDVPAIKDLSVKIYKGQATAVMGASGSGKSTLLGIIGGLNPPTAGRVIIDGIDIYALSREKRADFRREYLGFVFQQFQLIDYLTAMENVMLPLTTTAFPAKTKLDMARQALLKVQMSSKENRLPNQLSGGEQERVAIARAIVNEPPLILADEPTGNLDTRTTREIMELFKSLNESGHTVLMVTHNPENLIYMNRTITMQDGRLTEDSDNCPGDLQGMKNSSIKAGALR